MPKTLMEEQRESLTAEQKRFLADHYRQLSIMTRSKVVKEGFEQLFRKYSLYSDDFIESPRKISKTNFPELPSPRFFT